MQDHFLNERLNELEASFAEASASGQSLPLWFYLDQRHQIKREVKRERIRVALDTILYQYETVPIEEDKG